MVASNAFDARLLRYNIPKGKIRETVNFFDDQIIFDSYRKIFISRFQWSGFRSPEGYLESLIFYNGAAFFFNHPSGVVIVCTGFASSFNIYGEPINYTLTAPDGEVFKADLDDLVPVFDVPVRSLGDNYSYAMAPWLIADYYSRFAGDVGSTARTYSKGLKKPTIMATTDKTEVANKLAAQSILNNEPFVFIDLPQNITGDSQNLFHNTPHNASDLIGILTARKTLYSEGLQRFGVRGTLLEKSSYQSDTENDREDLSAELILDQAFRCRSKAVEELTSKGWGKGISCVLNPVLEGNSDDETDTDTRGIDEQ